MADKDRESPKLCSMCDVKLINPAIKVDSANNTPAAKKVEDIENNEEEIRAMIQAAKKVEDIENNEEEIRAMIQVAELEWFHKRVNNCLSHHVLC